MDSNYTNSLFVHSIFLLPFSLYFSSLSFSFPPFFLLFYFAFLSLCPREKKRKRERKYCHVSHGAKLLTSPCTTTSRQRHHRTKLVAEPVPTLSRLHAASRLSLAPLPQSPATSRTDIRRTKTERSCISSPCSIPTAKDIEARKKLPLGLLPWDIYRLDLGDQVVQINIDPADVIWVPPGQCSDFRPNLLESLEYFDSRSGCRCCRGGVLLQTMPSRSSSCETQPASRLHSP